MTTFTDTPTRTRIPKTDLAEILHRQTAIFTSGMRYDDIMHLVKALCRCECDQGCKEPFGGYCEFDHYSPNAIAYEGDKIHWRALTKACHSLKTNGLRGDKWAVAKVKRLGLHKTQHDKRLERGGSIQSRPNSFQSRPFQKRPPGHSAWGRGGGNVRYDD